MASERYTYTPLAWSRQIRLLRLHPASSPDDQELSVDLVPILLDSAPSFEALSYAWGEALPKYEILCSGRRAEIGASLFSALYHLRGHQPPGRSPWIWADALCINQDDTAERESQVRMMGDIYATASITVIWLGDADDHVTRAFDRLRRFSHIWKYLTESLNISDYITLTAGKELEARLAQNDNSEAHKIMQDTFGDATSRDKAFEDIWMLLRRAWFTRKWVIQEVAKSQDHRMVLLAGEEWTDWVHLKFWFEFLDNSGHWRSMFVSSCPWGVDFDVHDDTNTHSVLSRGAILARTFRYEDNPLSRLLATTAMFKCADPRDHIISLLGIAGNSSMFKDLIDYNTSTDDLYSRLTCAHLTNGLNLRILWSTHTIVPVDRRRTSSWIPNVEEMASRSALSNLNNFCGLGKMGNACQRTEIQATVNGKSLLIKGRIIDIIEQLGTDMTVFPELKYPRDWDSLWESEQKRGVWFHWLNECQTMAELAGQDERGLIDTMVVENFFERTRADVIEAAKKNFSGYQRIHATLATAPDESTWLKALNSMDSDMFRSVAVISGCHRNLLSRRFGRTRYSRIGWMPLVAEEGDHICVFDGMELPYAVRQRPGSEGNYVLVGDCLIPSLMNGEAMELPGVESAIITLD